MNKTGIRTVSAVAPNQILFETQHYVAVGAVISDSNVTAGSDGRKVIKAGTPLTGSLKARTTAFTKASAGSSSAASDAICILLHDVDVTDGSNNGTVLISGFVDLNKIDTTTAALITDYVETALKGSITFLK